MSRYPIGNGTSAVVIPTSVRYIGESVPGVTTVQYFYIVVAYTSDNTAVATSAMGVSAFGPQVLDGDHAININWSLILGASYYLIFKKAGSEPSIGNSEDLFYKAGFSETSVLDVGYAEATRNSFLNPGIGPRTIGAGVGSINGIAGDVNLVGGNNITITPESPDGQSISISAHASGSDGQVQFNQGGNFSASQYFVWDYTNRRLGINTSSPNYALDVFGDIDISLPSSYRLGGIPFAVQGTGGAVNLINVGNINGAAPVPATRIIATGAGLSGGGDLSANRTIVSVPFGPSGAGHSLGAVPDPGATVGATRFLREDSTWAVPSGTGGGTSPGGSAGYVQFNSAGTSFGGSANLFWDNVNNRLGIKTVSPNYALDVVGDIDIALPQSYRLGGFPFAVQGPSSNVNLINIANINGNPIASMVQTPWASNIDAASFALNNASEIVVVQTNASLYAASLTGAGGNTVLYLNNIGAGVVTTDIAFQTPTQLFQIGAAFSPAQLQLKINNAPFLVVSGSNGNVGINTTGPNYALDVAGDININLGRSYRIGGSPFAVSGGGTLINLQNISNINGAAPGQPQTPWTQTIVAAGNTLTGCGGIGCGNATTPSTYGLNIEGTPSVPLGGIRIYDSRPTFQAQIYLQNDAGNGVYLKMQGSTNATVPNCALIQLGPQPFVWIQNLVERFRMDTSGNVGIGTSGPNYKLDVSGDINIALPQSYRLGGSPFAVTGGGTLINLQNINTINGSAPGSPAGSTGQIQFNNAGAFGASANLFWDNTSNLLGIGGTPQSLIYGRRDSAGSLAPALTLDNQGGGAGAGGAIFYSNGTMSQSVLVSLQSSEDGNFSANWSVATKTPGAAGNSRVARLTVSSAGNVGIGTTSPASLLHVSSGVNMGQGIQTNVTIGPTTGPGTLDFCVINLAANGNGYVQLCANAWNDGTNWHLRDSTRDAWVVQTISAATVGSYSVLHSAPNINPASFNSMLTVLANGNVGIGNTAPTALLTVSTTNPGGTLPTNTRLFVQGIGGISATVPAGRISIGVDYNQDYGAYVGSMYFAGGTAGCVFGYRQGGADVPLVWGNATSAYGGKVGIGNQAINGTPYGGITALCAANSSPSLTSQSAATAVFGTAGVTELALFTDGNGFGHLQMRHCTASGNAYPLCLNPLGGSVGIGTTSPSHQLQVSTDDAAKLSTNTWTISSDVRLKQNVKPLEGGLSIISQIKPVEGEYNGLHNTPQGQRVVSVVVEDLKAVLPGCCPSHRGRLRDSDKEEIEILDFNSHEILFHLILAVQQLAWKMGEKGLL